MSEEPKKTTISVEDMKQSAKGKRKARKPQRKPEPEFDFGFDKLKIFFGEPLVLNDYITIHQPTIGEILKAGEKKVFSTTVAFTGNTTSYRIQLWDIGLDWNKITDWELFCMIIPTLPVEDTRIFFGDLDFTKFQIYQKNGTAKYPEDATVDENGEKILDWEKRPEQVLYDQENDYLIDELLYLQIREYLRSLFNQHPKTELIRGKNAKETVIRGEKNRLALQAKLNKDENKEYGDSYLLPLISTLLMYPGFKYNTEEIKELGIAQFMDGVRKMQVMESTSSLMRGMYSGFLDTSNMNLNQELNWFR